NGDPRDYVVVLAGSLLGEIGEPCCHELARPLAGEVEMAIPAAHLAAHLGLASIDEGRLMAELDTPVRGSDHTQLERVLARFEMIRRTHPLAQSPSSDSSR
ncbi:MAG: hypothetical protein OEW91_04445, partial [Acidimicrobiia bacterium]|nr:hypothetical protein [Acidimicrobiia bacterium]